MEVGVKKTVEQKILISCQKKVFAEKLTEVINKVIEKEISRRNKMNEIILNVEKPSTRLGNY